MKLTCKQAESLMLKQFDEEIKFLDFYRLRKHCKHCEMCKLKLYSFESVELPKDEEIVQEALERNREIDFIRKKKRVRRTLISSITVFVLTVVFLALTIYSGQCTFFASVDYGVSESYEVRTDTHPSYYDVEKVMDKCKAAFPIAGCGTILTSLKYDDEHSFSKKDNTENMIVINFSYFRVFTNTTSSKDIFFSNSDYSYIAEFDDEYKEWRIIGHYNFNKKDK